MIRHKIYIILIVFTSCNNSYITTIQSKNDTTKILVLALRTAFYHQNLPGISSLRNPYYSNDSILFTTTALSLKALPENIDSLKFKILPQDEICSMIRADSNLEKIRNYLSIRVFEKTDSGYNVGVQSSNCALFGAGGFTDISIGKEKDSFIVKKVSSSSLNYKIFFEKL